MTAPGVTAILNHANKDVISSDSEDFISLKFSLKTASWELARWCFLDLIPEISSLLFLLTSSKWEGGTWGNLELGESCES